MIGKVLDSSYLDALVRGSIAASAWLDTMRALSQPLYLPALAIAEIYAVRPDAGPDVADLLGHPAIIVGEVDTAAATAINELLQAVGVFDPLAGHVVHVARQRGWPALSADPGRLHRVDPGLEIDQL